MRTVAGLALVSLVLFGCGSNTEPGSLRVVSTNPGALATGVALTDTVTVGFSRALLPSSVNDATIVLSNNGLRVIGTRTLSDDGRTVSIIPKFGNNLFYVLEVRTGVEDAGGSALSQPYVTAFSTAGADQLTLIDPKGDTYNAALIPDATSLTASSAADTLTIQLGFAGPVSASTSGLPNALGGFVDLDTDQDPGTGSLALTDAFGPPGTQTGLGTEYYVTLFLDPQGQVSVVDIRTGTVTGTVQPSFANNTMTLRIPLEMLGNDEGNMNIAAVVGDLSVPTDIVPNVGHLTLGTSGQVGGKRSSTGLRVGLRARGAPIAVWGR